VLGGGVGGPGGGRGVGLSVGPERGGVGREILWGCGEVVGGWAQGRAGGGGAVLGGCIRCG